MSDQFSSPGSKFRFLRPDVQFSFLFATYFAVTLVSPTAARVSGSAILLFSIGTLLIFYKNLARKGFVPAWSHSDFRVLLASLSLLPTLFIFSFVVHEPSWRHFDRPAHHLYAMPIAFALFFMRPDPRPILMGMMLSLILAFPVSMGQWLDGAERALGNLPNLDLGNIAGAYSAAAIVLIIQALRRSSGLWSIGASTEPHRALTLVLLSLSAVLGISIALWSGNRTAWLSFPLIFLCCIPILGLGIKKSIFFVLTLAVALAILTMSIESLRERVMLGYEETRHFLEIFSSGSFPLSSGSSWGIRLESIVFSFRICLDSPWLGIGILGFKELAIEQALAGNLSPEIPRFFGMTHNQFMDACVQAGLPGLLLQLGFWAMLFIVFWRVFPKTRDPYSRSLLTIIYCQSVAYAFAATTGGFFHSSIGTLFYSMIWAMLAMFFLPTEFNRQNTVTHR